MNIRDQFKADVLELDRQRKLCADAAYELREGIEGNNDFGISMEFEVTHRFEKEDIAIIKSVIFSHLQTWKGKFSI